MSDVALLDLHDRWVLILLGQHGDLEYMSLFEKLTILSATDQFFKIKPEITIFKQRIDQLERDEYIITKTTIDQHSGAPKRIISLSPKGAEISMKENAQINKNRLRYDLEDCIKQLRVIETDFLQHKSEILQRIKRLEDST